MKNKYQRARILIIDRELSKGKVIKTQKLKLLIAEAGIEVPRQSLPAPILSGNHFVTEDNITYALSLQKRYPRV